jgi:sulfopyruvate decarboxylase alpha subunit
LCREWSIGLGLDRSGQAAENCACAADDPIWRPLDDRAYMVRTRPDHFRSRHASWYHRARGKGDWRLNGSAAVEPADWRDEIFAALKRAEIRQVGYVPDAGHARLIELCRGDPEIRAVPLTSEEEGVALAAGAWLGGERAALLMQSSGVGNCVNMLSLTKNCRFPLVMLVTMRGEWAEFNPWQVPMGAKTQAALELMDVLVYRVEREEDAAETVAAAFDIAFNGDLAAAVLLSQRLIGAKRWVK